MGRSGFEFMKWLTAQEQRSLERGELNELEHLNLEKLARNQSLARNFLFGDKKLTPAVGQAREVDTSNLSTLDARRSAKENMEAA